MHAAPLAALHASQCVGLCIPFLFGLIVHVKYTEPRLSGALALTNTVTWTSVKINTRDFNMRAADLVVSYFYFHFM